MNCITFIKELTSLLCLFVLHLIYICNMLRTVVLIYCSIYWVPIALKTIFAASKSPSFSYLHWIHWIFSLLVGLTNSLIWRWPLQGFTFVLQSCGYAWRPTCLLVDGLWRMPKLLLGLCRTKDDLKYFFVFGWLRKYIKGLKIPFKYQTVT